MNKIETERLYSVISDVLGIPVEHISEECSPDSIDTWTSLTHINLVMAIESEFNVSFTPEDTMDMLSVKLISIVLDEYLTR